MSGGFWAWLRARFSFRGRASRREYWLQFLAAIVAYVASWQASLALLMPLLLAPAHLPQAGQRAVGALVVLLCIWLGGFVLYVWALAAVAVRRYHDLGLPFRFNPFDRAGIQCMFSRGTVGPNGYGPDPRGAS